MTVGDATGGCRGVPAGMETTQRTDPKCSAPARRAAAPNSNSPEGSPSAVK